MKSEHPPGRSLAGMIARRCLLFVVSALLVGCATPSAPPPMLAARLEPGWIASAQHLQSGDRTIYYRGTARKAATSTGRNWTGSIRGEVLMLQSGMAMAMPSGMLTLSPGGAISIVGPHQIVTSDTPTWKHLLLP